MTAFADLREIGENLGRFASTREKADAPADRILVQADKGTLKLVAGDFRKTIIATVGPTEQSARAVVSSRLLLGAFKTFKSKGEATFDVTDRGVTITTGFGSSVELPAMDMAKYLRPVPQPWEADSLTVPFEAGFLPAACKYLASSVGDFSPYNQVYGKANGVEFYLSANDNHIGTKVGPLTTIDVFSVHFPGEDFNALRGLEQSGWFWFPPRHEQQVHRAQIYSGRYMVVMVLLPDYPLFPTPATPTMTAKVVGNRKTLIETFKALAGHHEYNRVVMKASDGAFTVKGGDTGAVKVDVEVEGTGTIPINATYIAKVLNTVDGKNATIEFADSPSLVRITGETNPWPVLVAPMK
jgi:hypothetical protein